MAALIKGNNAKRQKRRATQKNRKKRPAQSSDWFVNFLMLGLSVLVLSFVWSFWNRHSNNRLVAEEMSLIPDPPSMTSPETLIAEKVYPDVTVEILNGCGKSGMAARFKDILQEKSFDVQHTENADHFDYQETIVLARSDNTDGAFSVAEQLGLDPKRVKTEQDPTRRVDVTLIIGHDYPVVPAFVEDEETL